MTRQTFPAIAVMLSLGPFTTIGLCQAAAEYSIMTSHVAGATAKGGTVLGKAAQQLSGRVQQKLSKSTEQSRQTGQLNRAPGDHPVTAAPGVESANGLEIIYGPTSSKASDTKQGAESKSPPCASSPANDSPGNKAVLPCTTKSQENYPSVVNLSFGKR